MYEGLAWLTSTFQDSAREIYVLGKTLTVNPADWRFNHSIKADIGTGSGDDEQTLNNLSVILQLQMKAIESQSSLSDEAKVYTTVGKMVKAMGLHSPNEFFNDPAEPEQAMKAELDILRRQVQELAGALEQKNPTC